MNSISKWLRLVLASFSLLVALAPNRAGAQDYYNNGSYQDSYDDGSYQDFYDDLSPYGQWIEDGQYGYVWVPDVANDFRPYYTNGYWVNTEYGNTWVSDYPWGWAAFHYGRWTYDDYYGWIWIPGNEWGPAWVSWRSGGGYYGWAPLGPGVSIDLSFGSWNAPYSWWIFTPQQYVLSPRFHQYCRPASYNPRIINNTTIINNTYVHNRDRYVSGPRRAELEQATGRQVQQYRFNETRRPVATQVRGNKVAMYRPEINRSGGRPQRVIQEQRPITITPREVSPNRQPGFRNGSFGGRNNGRADDVTPKPVVDPRIPGRDQPMRQPDRTFRQPAQPVPQQQPAPQPDRQAPTRDWGNRGMDRPQYQNNPVQQPRPQMDRPQRSFPQPQRPPVQQERPIQQQPVQRPVQQERPQFQQPQRIEQPRPVQQDRSFQQARPVEQPRQAPQPQPARQNDRPNGFRR